MRQCAPIAAAALLLAACGSQEDAPNAAANAVGDAPAAQANGATVVPLPPAAPAADTANAAAPQADAQASGAQKATAAAGACLMQGSERLDVTPLRAIGTEPFWNARIEGRCVTYSNPEDQDGTRIWTRFTPGRGGGTWSGALGGRRFELRTRPHPRCSDGMSDKVYPIAVDLTVGGERRRGCAEPA